MKHRLAVDPGSSSGAIAAKWADGAVTVARMPDTPERILSYFRSIKDSAGSVPVVAVVENVGASMPGNAARSSRVFIRHMGHLDMALLATGIEPLWVVPKVWQFGLFGPGLPHGMEPEQKKARKDAIYQAVTTWYPDVAGVTRGTADALAILRWFCTKEGVR